MKLVVSRPAAAAPSQEGAELASAYVGILAMCGFLAVACAVAALFGSV